MEAYETEEEEIKNLISQVFKLSNHRMDKEKTLEILYKKIDSFEGFFNLKNNRGNDILAHFIDNIKKQNYCYIEYFGNNKKRDNIKNLCYNIFYKIIEKTKDLNSKNNKGKTPLMILVSTSKKEIVSEFFEALIKSNKDIDFNLSDNKGKSQFHYVVDYIASLENKKLKIKFLNIIEKRSENLNVNHQNNEGNTVGHSVLLSGSNPEQVFNHSLFRNTIDFSIKNNEGKTPFMLLARKNNSTFSNTLDIIISNKVSLVSSLINEKDKEGNNILFYCKKLSIYEMLIELGADYSVLNNHDQSIYDYMLEKNKIAGYKDKVDENLLCRVQILLEKENIKSEVSNNKKKHRQKAL